MDTIKMFLTEVTACDVFNDTNGKYSYNGFKLEETSVAYHVKLHALYKQALMKTPFMSKETKEGVGIIIKSYKEAQSLFDAPDEAWLESMNKEIQDGNDNPSLKRERNFVKMVRECVSLQKFYLDEFATAIGCISAEQVVSELDVVDDIAATTSTDENLIKGVKGLAEFLGCGINSAQGIINSKMLEEKKIQYKIGKAWRFNKNKLASLLETNPEVFKKLPKE